MKSFLLTLIALVSFSASAARTTYSCWTEEGVRMVISQIGTSDMEENKPYRFSLRVFEANAAAPFINETATVKTEDVMFAFRVNGKGIRGMIYMDELNESWMKINGREVDFEDCDFE